MYAPAQNERSRSAISPLAATTPSRCQTMLNVPVEDSPATWPSSPCGCCRVPDRACHRAHPQGCGGGFRHQGSGGYPVVADIHFDYKAALAALDAGADKIRINPGNIGMMTASRRWPMPATPKMCPSVSASTAAVWKSTSWPSTAHRCPKPWWKVPCTCAPAGKARLQ